MIVMARVDWNELSRKAQAKAKANKPSEEVQPLSAKNERTQSTYDLAPARGEEPTPRPSPEAQERERAIKDIIAEGELTHHHLCCCCRPCMACRWLHAGLLAHSSALL